MALGIIDACLCQEFTFLCLLELEVPPKMSLLAGHLLDSFAVESFQLVKRFELGLDPGFVEQSYCGHMLQAKDTWPVELVESR
jgi:hypothetical protein